MKCKITTLLALLGFALFPVGNASSLFEEDIPKAQVGLGIGIPYAIAGVKIEAHTNDYVSPFIALGMGAEDAPAEFSFGGHLYLFDPNSSIRPRLTFVNGINTLVARDPLSEQPTYDEGLRGNSVGFGASFGKNYGVDLDILYIVSSSKEKAEDNTDVFSDYQVEKTPEVTLSLGFHWAIF